MTALRCLLGRHRRSAKDRYLDRDGLYKSVCRRCGARLLRERSTGRWLAYQDRDLRRRTRGLRRAIDRMTGPVLFLLAIGLALGLMLWLRMPEEGSRRNPTRAAPGTPPLAARRGAVQDQHATSPH